MFWNKKQTNPATVVKSIPFGAIIEWITGRAFWNKFDAQTAITEGFQSNPWVYACVKKRGDAAASVPLIVQQRKGEEWATVPANHPLQRLIDRPHQDIDKCELIRLFVCHADLAGDAYLLKVRLGNRKPAELFPLMPQDVAVIPGKDRLIQGYKNTKTNAIYGTEDIIHLSYTNPDNLFTGQPPLMACGKSVDIDNAAAAFQKISMQNRGVPDGLVSIEQELTPEQWQDATKFVRENMNGVGNARGNFVLSKAKYQQLSQSMIDLDFQGGRNAAMKQICAAYGVPEAMITGMDSANVASATQVRKSFWQDTMIPGVMGQLLSALNLSLVPDFGNSDQLRIIADYSAIEALQENFKEKLANAHALWQLGYPVNVINQRLNLGMDDLDTGNIGYIPSGMIPAGIDIEPEPETAATRQEAYGE